MRSRLACDVPGVELRFATPVDAPTVLRLIRSLASFEELESEVTADAETLRKSLFGDHDAEVILATFEGEVAGFALFFHNYSTFLGRPGLYLEDLYVDEGFRNRGIGRALLRALVRLAQERGCGRLDWAVLDWNTDAIRFYRRLGARSLDDWVVFRLDEEAMQTLAARDGRRSER